jgi:hypothetical protein
MLTWLFPDTTMKSVPNVITDQMRCCFGLDEEKKGMTNGVGCCVGRSCAGASVHFLSGSSVIDDTLFFLSTT